MPNRQKQKGDRFEREIVDWHLGNNVEAERVPLSGAVKGSYAADIRLGPNLAYTGECKRFKTGLAKLYDALEQDNADVVFARADRRKTIVCLDLETWAAVMREMGWAE